MAGASEDPGGIASWVRRSAVVCSVAFPVAGLVLAVAPVSSVGARVGAGTGLRGGEAGPQDGTQTRSLGPVPLPPQLLLGGASFLDNASRFCYEVGVRGNWHLSMLDNTSDPDVRSRVVRRSGTAWCQGTIGAPVAECIDKGAPKPLAASACPGGANDCQRGHDLLQEPPGGATCETRRLLYLHGGSWYYYSPWDAHYAVHTSKLAASTGAVVMSVDYPLIGAWTPGGGSAGGSGGELPEYRGNAQGMLDHALAAWRWLASDYCPEQRGQELANGTQGQAGPGAAAPDGTCADRCKWAQPPPLFIAGDSSGGGFALSLMLELRSREREGRLDGLRMPAGALLESPWLNLLSNTPTYYSNNFAAFPSVKEAAAHPESGALTGDLMFHVLAEGASVGDPGAESEISVRNALEYCGCPAQGHGSVPLDKCVRGTCGLNESSISQLRDWRFSPYWAEAGHLEGLPPVYIATSATELLAGDTMTFAQNARRAGVMVRSELFSGMWHTFPQWSEGCGSGQPLWQGNMVLRHMGEFVRDLSWAAKACPCQLRPKQADCGSRRGGASDAAAHPMAAVADDSYVNKIHLHDGPLEVGESVLGLLRGCGGEDGGKSQPN